MKNYILSSTLLVLSSQCLSGMATLSEARAVMHCIKAGDRDWLNEPLSAAQTFRLGMVHDKKSYPGKDHIIAVIFEKDIKGQFFDLRRDCDKNQCIYTIENNGSFIVKGSRFEFVDPPLGGIWTQGYLESNIRKVMRKDKSLIPVSAVLKSFTGISCSSYAQNTSKNSAPE